MKYTDTMNADTIADLGYKVEAVAELFDKRADERMTWADRLPWKQDSGVASRLREIAEELDELSTEYAQEVK